MVVWRCARTCQRARRALQRGLQGRAGGGEEGVVPFPCAPELVTPPWLTAQLQRCGQLFSGAAVKELEWTQMGEGVGLLSLLYRLRIHYSGSVGELAPHSLVAKFGHAEPEVRRLAQANGSYQREVGFYDWMGSRPRGGGTCAPLSLKTPAIYFCAFDPPSGKMAVVMEDLAGVLHLDQVKGASLSQAIAVMRDMARSHAQHWGSPELDRLPWLPKMNEERFKAFDPGEYPRSWPRFLRLFGDLLPDSAKETLESFHRHCPTLLDLLGSPPRTLLHGDLRLDNVYQLHGDFRGDDAIHNEDRSEAAEWDSAMEAVNGLQLVYMDFGDCGAGRGVADVGYFLSQSLDPRLRRRHEKALLRTYYEVLMGSGQVAGYTWEECWEDYRRAVLYYWVLAVNMASHVPEGGKDTRVFRLSEAVIRRSIAAMTDLRCLDMLK